MEKFRQNCQNCILLHQRNIVREFFLRKTFIFIIFCGHQAKTFRNGCQNWILIYQMNIVGELFLFKRTNKFIFFSGFGWIFSGRVVITAVDNFGRTFLVTTFGWKSCSFISFLRASVDNFSAQLSKLHSTLPEEHCKRNFFEKKPSFPNFSAGFSWKFCQRVVKTGFLLTRGTMVGKIFV